MHSSKRMTCRKKYKIIKKVREHNRKLRKQEKANPNKRAPKDPGIPNLYPFKEQMLKQIEEKKQKEEEMKKKRKEAKKKDVSRKRKLEDLQKDAEKRAKLFAKKQANNSADQLGDPKSGPIESSRKSFYKEFKKVVELSDVVIQVLDARDPIGCRCPQLEELVMTSGKNKKIVLLLNKIDLIPKDIVEKWLKYLRSEFPTVAFKASTQTQRQKLAQSKVPTSMASSDLLQSSSCIGAGTLLKLLGNYCRSANIKTTITVGIVGFPNVGKSSVINSLKRSKACSVGSTPGVTKNMQEVQLDHHVRLLDCPGIVMATGSSDTQTILRNAVKVETLEDPIQPVEAILSRCNKEQVMRKYCVGDYSDAVEFLTLFAKRLGKLKKGGVPDQLAAAKALLQDWNNGKITFYTHPPERSLGDGAETTVVQYWGAGFDIKALEKEEKDDLSGLLSAMGTALVLDPGKPVAMEADDIEEESEDDAEVSDNDDEEEEEEEMVDSDKEVTVQSTVISMRTRSKTNEKVKEKEEKKKVTFNDEVNVQINKKKKKAFKSKQKEDRKRINKLLSEEDNKMKDDDDAYDFNEVLK